MLLLFAPKSLGLLIYLNRLAQQGVDIAHSTDIETALRLNYKQLIPLLNQAQAAGQITILAERGGFQQVKITPEGSVDAIKGQRKYQRIAVFVISLIFGLIIGATGDMG